MEIISIFTGYFTNCNLQHISITNCGLFNQRMVNSLKSFQKAIVKSATESITLIKHIFILSLQQLSSSLPSFTIFI